MHKNVSSMFKFTSMLVRFTSRRGSSWILIFVSVLHSPITMNGTCKRYPPARSPSYAVHYSSVGSSDNLNNSNNNNNTSTDHQLCPSFNDTVDKTIKMEETSANSSRPPSNLGSSMASLASICSSTQVVPNVNDISAIDGSYIGTIYDTHRLSKASSIPTANLFGNDNTMLTEASGFQYSCADVSEALNHMTTKTPNNFRQLLMQTPRLRDISDIDMTSTTFKTGLSLATTTTESCVDPEDLVNRIDELFFRDMMV